MLLTLSGFLPTFLTAAVEWVEAFTIVLAVSLTIGWRAAATAAGAALLTLAALTLATGGALQAGLPVTAIQFGVGIFLLLFGTRWLAKAIARHAGLKPPHDEAEAFAETSSELRGGTWYAAWLIAYKGVLLEGLEVWLIVVAFSIRSGLWLGNGAAALIALLLVVLTGIAIRAPLQRVPENAIKFAVGAMIVSFGTYWTLEAVGSAFGIAGIWPLADWTLPVLVAFYVLGGLAAAGILRRRVSAAEAAG
jgi:uncharacterized membrane protein